MKVGVLLDISVQPCGVVVPCLKVIGRPVHSFKTCLKGYTYIVLFSCRLALVPFRSAPVRVHRCLLNTQESWELHFKVGSVFQGIS